MKTVANAERIASIQEVIYAAHGDWHEATALWSVQKDIGWLLRVAERLCDLPALIGTADESQGLEHWHHASGGRAEPTERDGVFVDRAAVLCLVDEVWEVSPMLPRSPSTPPGKPDPIGDAQKALVKAIMACVYDASSMGVMMSGAAVNTAIRDFRAAIEAEAALPVPAPQAVPVITEDPEANGDLDDLFVNGGIDSFHVERMDSGHWWFAVYLNDGTRLNFNLHSSRKITARVEREETGPIRAALPVPALDALRIEEAVCRSEIAGSGHATGDIPCEWHTAAGNVRVQRFITALGSQEDVK